MHTLRTTLATLLFNSALGISLGWSQGVQRLAIEAGTPSPADLTGNRSAAVTIRAFENAGLTPAPTNAQVRLQVTLHPPAGVVISEYRFDGTEVEFTNVGSEPVDMSGWTLELATGAAEAPGSALRRIEGPAVLQPGAVLVWSSNPGAADVFPRLAHPRPFQGYFGSTIQIYDATGGLVDQLLLTPLATQRQSLWNGNPVSVSQVSGGSIRRVGNLNQFAAQDWASGPATIGSLNPGLVLPFVGRRIPVSVAPNLVTLSQGVWSGTLSFPGHDASHWRLGATVSNQILWETPPLLIPPSPKLLLSVLEGSPSANEAAPGRAARMRVQLAAGEVASAAIPVSISFDVPGEFTAPGQVIIAAGTNSAEFEVANMDDALADGRARVQLRVTAPGFGVTGMPFTNEDDESGRLTVSLPARAGEGVGLLSRPGQVMLGTPALHDVEVQLVSGGRLIAPPRVIIPAGSSFANFLVQVRDDSFLNIPPFLDSVSARTAGWPASKASMAVTDNEPAFFRIEAPQNVPEGRTQTGALVFNAIPDEDLPVELQVSGDAFDIPELVLLPAGTNRVEFPIRAREDAFPRQDILATICAATVLSRAECVRIIPLDNDSPLASIQVQAYTPNLDRDGVRISGMLLNERGGASLLDGVAKVRIVQSSQPVRFEADSPTIEIVDGRFDARLRMVGSSESVVVEVEFNGARGTSPAFEVLSGLTMPGSFEDVAAWPGRQPLLALRIETNGPAAQGFLVQLDPTAGTILQRLPLPRPAHRIAVSDDGGVAWLASTADTLQRVDLPGWVHSGESSLALTNGSLAALLLAVSPGSTDDLVAMVGPASGESAARIEIAGFRSRQILPRRLDLGANGIMPGLIPGRVPGEFHAVLAQNGHRLRLVADGVEAIVSRSPVSPGHLPAMHPILAGPNIVYGGGIIVDVDTLEDRGAYELGFQFPTRTAVLSFPELDSVLFADDSGVLRTMTVGNRTLSGSTSLPWDRNPAVVERMVRWGNRGAAMLSWSGRKLYVLGDPVRPTAVADLSLTLQITNRIPWRGDAIQLPQVPSTLVISNAGPDVARQISLLLAGQQVAAWPSIPPGGSVTFSPGLAPANVGSNQFSLAVSSTTQDPATNNNSATAGVWVEPLVIPGEALLNLQARHLVARPGSNELWAVVGVESGTEGVVILDAATLAQKRTIAVGPDPRQIAPMADGAGFYVRLGTNRIVRWNLSKDRIDLERTFTSERLVDFASVGQPVERLGILLMERLLLIENGEDIQSFDLLPSLSRRLATFGNQLWAAREREVRVYAADKNGLNLVRTRSMLAPTSQLRFNTDGSWAAFDGYLVHPELGLTQNVASHGAAWLPGYDGTFFSFNGKALSRMEPPNFFTAAEAVIPSLYGAGQVLDQVRWSSNGFAFRTQPGLIISTRSPLVRSGKADLGVSISAVGTPAYRTPSEFRVIVTNRGPDRVERAQLAIGMDQSDWIRSESPAVYDFGSLRLLVGPIPAGESREARVTLLPNRYPTPTSWVVVTAALTSGEQDQTVEDRSAWTQFPIATPRADLGLSLSLPTQPVLNVPFEVSCTLTNRGPGSIFMPSLYFNRPSNLTWLGSEGGRTQNLGIDNAQITDLVETLGPGASVTVRIQMLATKPGLFPLSVTPSFPVEDPVLDTADQAIVIHVPSPNGFADYPSMSIDLDDATWSVARRQWILSHSLGLVYLNPETLAPEGRLSFPAGTSRMFLNNEGTHYWLSQDYLGFVRCNLATGLPDLIIEASENPIPANATVATVPGRPDMLVSYGFTPESRLMVVAFQGGKALPDRYSDDLTFQGRSLEIGASAQGRVYVSNGGQFRELELTPAGLQFRRNLDSYQFHVSSPIHVEGGLLFQGWAPALDLDTLERLPLGLVYQPFVNGFTHRVFNLPDGSSRLEAFDVLKRQAAWWLPDPKLVTRTANGGTNGILVLGRLAGRIRPPTRTPVDLRLSAPVIPYIGGAGKPFDLTLRLQQYGPWLAGDTRIEVALPPGMELVAPAPVGNPPGFTIPFTEPATNLTVRLRAGTVGPARLVFRARPATAVDPIAAAAQATVDLVVPEEPVVLLTDMVVPENGTPLTLRLSAPAPEQMSVTLLSDPITTETNDLLSPTLNVVFYPGQQEAQAVWIRADTTVESDEDFWLSLAPGPGVANTNAVRVTIRNDDRAQLVARSETRPEGNTNAAPGLFVVSTDASLETQVELGFATVGITATSGSDFLPLSGRIVLGPGQPTNTIRVTIVGDTDFEPAETLSLAWSDPLNARIPTTAPILTLQNDDPPPSPVLSLLIDADNRPVVSFPTVSGFRYSLQSRAQLASGSWTIDGFTVNGTGGTVTIRSGFRADSMRFYRVQVN